MAGRYGQGKGLRKGFGMGRGQGEGRGEGRGQGAGLGRGNGQGEGLGGGEGMGQGSGLGRGIRSQIRRAQETEITEHGVYEWLAKRAKTGKNRELLQRIADDEKRHARFWQDYTQVEVKPKPFKLLFHKIVASLLGFTFSVKLMEQGEEAAQVNYQEIAKEVPEAKEIQKEEDEHEKQLLGLLDEEGLKYVGSMVLGVNDALVELTGALAGFTLALQNTRLIAVIGLITGIAASMSMGASEFLSTKAEGQEKDPIKASIYTGGMYIVTVILLVIPFFVFANVFISLGVTLAIAILIILLFTFYISVAQDLPFKKRFLEMAGISLGVSAISFVIGYLVKDLLGVDV